MTTQIVLHKIDYEGAASFFSSAMLAYAATAQAVTLLSKRYFIENAMVINLAGACLGMHLYTIYPVWTQAFALGAFLYFRALNYLVSREKVVNQLPFLQNLNAEMKGKPQPFVPNEKRIQEVEDALTGVNCTNGLLIGNTGSGKSTLIEGIAWMIEHNKFPKESVFYGKTIYSLNLNGLIAGTEWRGSFEKKVMELLQTSQKGIILFIDEFHRVFSLGNSSNDANNNLAEVLKRDIVRNVQIIGGTTPADLAKSKIDAAFMRRFAKIQMKPLETAECFQILKAFTDSEGFKKAYPSITFQPIELTAIVAFSNINLTSGIAQPSLAITLCEQVAKKMKREKKQAVSFDFLVETFKAHYAFAEGQLIGLNALREKLSNHSVNN